MIIVMGKDSSKIHIQEVVDNVESMGLKAHLSEGSDKQIIGLIGDTIKARNSSIGMMPGVEKIVFIKESYKLASRSFKQENTVIDVNGVKIGGRNIVIMAGPCSVESSDQIMNAARAVKAAGAQFLRGGAFKPRTSPYGFQGLGEEALKLMVKAKEETGLNIITEVTNEEIAKLAHDYVDMFQIGARNVQNFNLLKAVGKTNKPVLLKRGMSTTIEEWLNSAEYIMSEGNQKVILCERGIRTFETATRNTLDISAVAVLKKLTHLPVIIDPSHAGGKAEYVESLAKAGIAAGADGLIIEVHPNPEEAWSDAAQQLTPDEFARLSVKLNRIAEAVDRN